MTTRYKIAQYTALSLGIVYLVSAVLLGISLLQKESKGVLSGGFLILFLTALLYLLTLLFVWTAWNSLITSAVFTVAFAVWYCLQIPSFTDTLDMTAQDRNTIWLTCYILFLLCLLVMFWKFYPRASFLFLVASIAEILTELLASGKYGEFEKLPSLTEEMSAFFLRYGSLSVTALAAAAYFLVAASMRRR